VQPESQTTIPEAIKKMVFFIFITFIFGSTPVMSGIYRSILCCLIEKLYLFVQPASTVN
jgi:hypothetical protein